MKEKGKSLWSMERMINIDFILDIKHNMRNLKLEGIKNFREIIKIKSILGFLIKIS